MDAAPQPRIAVDRDRIAAFCQKWHIVEFSLFGSVLRDDFRPDSDVDVLVVFAPEVELQGGELLGMERELKEMFGRSIDIVEKRRLVNPFRRHHILTNKQILYAA